MANAQELRAGSWLKKKGKGLEHGELEDFLREANDRINGGSDAGTDRPKKVKRRQKPTAEERPKKKHKAALDACAQPPVPAMPVFDLVELELAAP